MSESPFRALEYTVGSATVRVEYTDITTLKVDAMVSSDDIDLSMGGGVSAALRRAGGEIVWREAQNHAPVELGDVVVTNPGRLSAKYVFHAAVLDYYRRALTNVDLIRRVTRKVLRQGSELSIRSVALPALATGVAGLSPEHSAVAMVLEIVKFLQAETSLKLVVIALFPRADLPREKLSEFYARVARFLQLVQEVETVANAVANLEDIYRELKMEKSAETAARSTRQLNKRVLEYELEFFERSGYQVHQSGALAPPGREIEEELESISTMRFRPEEIAEKVRAVSDSPAEVRRLEREYITHRSTALEKLIVIRRRNVTDLETEIAKVGFSTSLNRQLEHEKDEIFRLEKELKELEEGMV